MNDFTDYYCFYCPTCGTEVAGWGDHEWTADNFCECPNEDDPPKARNIIEDRDRGGYVCRVCGHKFSGPYVRCIGVDGTHEPTVVTPLTSASRFAPDPFDRAEREEAASPSFDTRTPALQKMTTAELEARVAEWADDTIDYWRTQALEA